ncbi:MAG: OmpA family protein [Verrucomicrobiae bacterium]|nr:OmpA family protein [Verrucomicrobiae bacterium]
MNDVLPELIESDIARPTSHRRSFRLWLLVVTGLALAIVGWTQRSFLLSSLDRHEDDLDESLQKEVAELTAERDNLAAEIQRLQLGEFQVDPALGSDFDATRDLSDEVAGLNEQIETLTNENENLNFEIDRRERAAGREIDRLNAQIGNLESLARDERETWNAEKKRLLAANENLGKQNAILKDRLSSILVSSIDLPEGSNAEEALDRGNLEFDALEQKVGLLETQLAESTKQRNVLARSLQETRESQSAIEMVTSLSAESGDRMMADLSGRFDALKRQSESARENWEKERSNWSKERAGLVATRDSLRADVESLRTQLAALATSGSSATPESERKNEIAPASPETEEPIANRDTSEPILIEEPANLSEPTRPIFDQLRALDDSSIDLEKAYEAISREQGGRLALTIPFTAGSASLDTQAREKIRALVDTSPEARFLAIGYASVDGSEDANRDLSSRRAYAAAEAVAELGPQNPVEAVYFGQTRRFDSSRRAANRVVEIWQID